MLTVRDLSQHLVLSSKTIRPNIPLGAGCMGHCEMVWSAVCSLAPHSQFVRARSETPFVHGRTETSNTRTQTVELDPGCPGHWTANKPLPLFEIPFNFYFYVKCGYTFIVHKRMGLGRTWLYFWKELPGRLPLLGKRFQAMGGPGCKKIRPCHLWCRHDHEAKLFLEDLANYLDWGKWC